MFGLWPSFLKFFISDGSFCCISKNCGKIWAFLWLQWCDVKWDFHFIWFTPLILKRFVSFDIFNNFRICCSSLRKNLRIILLDKIQSFRGKTKTWKCLSLQDGGCVKSNVRWNYNAEGTAANTGKLIRLMYFSNHRWSWVILLEGEMSVSFIC